MKLFQITEINVDYIYISKIVNFFHFFQHKYLLKFSTDGYALTNLHGAVQACIKLMEVDNEWKPLGSNTSVLPKQLQSEICVFHYKGKEVITHDNNLNISCDTNL